PAPRYRCPEPEPWARQAELSFEEQGLLLNAIAERCYEAPPVGQRPRGSSPGWKESSTEKRTPRGQRCASSFAVRSSRRGRRKGRSSLGAFIGDASPGWTVERRRSS